MSAFPIQMSNDYVKSLQIFKLNHNEIGQGRTSKETLLST